MGTIIRRADISELLKSLRNKGKTIVATNGCFDILHVGHVRYYKKQKALQMFLLYL